MKSIQFFLLLFALSFNSFSQEFKIKIPPLNEEIAINNNGKTVLNTDNDQLNTIYILSSNLSSGDYILSSDQLNEDVTFNSSNNEHLIIFNELQDTDLTIKKGSSTIVKSKIKLNVVPEIDDSNSSRFRRNYRKRYTQNT